MKKNFFKWAVLFTALATALTFASCGDDDDDDDQNQQNTENNEGNNGGNTNTYSFTENKISVSEGKTYVYSLDKVNVSGEFTVTAAKAGEVTLTINNKSVTLSDAGASYLSNGFVAWKTADVTDPKDILFCLLVKSTNISSVENATKAEFSAAATPIYFSEK